MGRLEIDNLTKLFGDGSESVVAVDEITLDIPDGEFVVIVGPSGCGKSTTLRMIAGLETITGGEIRLDGEVINEKAPKDRNIAMVFQNHALYPHKTARGNMEYPLKLSSNHSEEEITQRVESAAELLDITEHLDKKPSSLSGGQQQRVATGRAIVREPEVFLFDEPLSNLDANMRKHMRTELAKLHADLQTTTIYVTHDQEEAMTLADRIVVLNHGQLQQVGTPKEVYYSPANLFVADFIGSPSMNAFDVEIQVDDLGGELVHDGFSYALSENVVQALREATDSSKLVLGVRPENLRPVMENEEAREAPSDRILSAHIDVVEVIGSDNIIYTSMGEQECRLRTSSQFEPEPETDIEFTFDEEDMHIFDRETGEAIYNGKDTFDTSSKIPTRDEPLSE